MGLCPSFLQNRLLCVQTVVVITWFSCALEPPVGNGGRESNRRPPRSLRAPSTALLATVPTVPGPAVPHLRHRPPVTATVGASAPVSLGEQRRGCSGEGHWSQGGRCRLTAHCLPPAPERHGLRSVDHRLRLFLDVEVFTDAQEEFQCCRKVCASLALPCAPN